MVWGCISYWGMSSIYFHDTEDGATVKSGEYQQCLKEALLPCLHDSEYLNIPQRTPMIFMEDGASPHRSKSTITWVRGKLPRTWKLLNNKSDPCWPPNSPDLNPIEQLWSIMNDRVVEQKPTSMEHLKEIIQDVWWSTDQSTIQRWYDTYHARVKRCVDAKGKRFRVL